MARAMLMTIGFIFTPGLLHPTDSAMTVFPETIAVDLTQSLNLNCSFSYQPSRKIASLISIVVSKSDSSEIRSSAFKDLASVNQLTPDKVTIITPSNATISGHVSSVGTSYLSFDWAYPRKEEAGIFRCRALGLDKLGRSTSEHYTSKVTASKPTLDQVIDVVKLQQMRMDVVLNVLLDMSAKMKFVDENFRTFSKEFGEEMKESKMFKYKLMKMVAKDFIKSDEYRGKYYLVSKEEPVSDDLADSSCSLHNGYLAEIDDSDEHAFVKHFLHTAAPKNKKYVLVGGRKSDKSGFWVYPRSGKMVGYTEWSVGKPSNFKSGCLYLRIKYDWKFGDYNCQSPGGYNAYLCEIPKPFHRLT